jgi:acetylornithine deacetylase/succinyl-diaminopimelate desuccinylase-like protein
VIDSAWLQALDEEAAGHALAPLVRSPAYQTSQFEADPAVQHYLRTVVVGEAANRGLSAEVDMMGNVVIRLGPATPSKVLFFGYAMTHPPNRMEEPLDPRTRVDELGARWMRGRGASEQKGALAAVLLAAAALKKKEDELRRELVVCISPAGETGRHDAAEALMRSFDSSAFAWCVVTIGTNNAVCVANKGRIDATVTIHGHAAHSSTPWLGTNAIDGAVEAVIRLRRIVLKGEHPNLGRPTLTATAIRSWPEATHTVPDTVNLVIDRRLLPGDNHLRALDEIRAALSDLASWKVNVEPGPFMFPSEISTDSPLYLLLRQTFVDVVEREPEPYFSHGCVDAGFFNQLGIPSVMLGPGEQTRWHTDDEEVRLEDVSLCAKLYAAAALRELNSR